MSIKTHKYFYIFPLLFVSFSILIPASIRAQEHWETIINANTNWKYYPATSEPDNEWRSIYFDDESWSEGTGGIGYGDNDDATIIDPVNSLYLRKIFVIDSISIISKILLDIDYDDAFVAYLNGEEIARSDNITDDNPTFNNTLTFYKEALMYQGGLPERYDIPLTSLKADTNILAIQILNYNISSSDLSAIPFLHAFLNSSQIIYSPTPDWFVKPFEFHSSNLPILKINTKNQEILDDPRIIAELSVINNGYNQINTIEDSPTDYFGNISIEIRGQSSQMFPKKSFSIETQDSLGENQNVSLLGMPLENDWILYAPYTDKSMLRNVITFELAKKLSGYSSCTKFCELLINGNYQGVYVLMEKIKKDENRVDIATLKETEVSGDDLTGGYIFKVDKIDTDYVEGFTGWKSAPIPSYPNAMDIVYQYYYPKAENMVLNQKNYLQEEVTQTEKALIGSAFSDPNVGYNQHLNTGSFIDFMLISELSKEVDKYRFSTYFHKMKDSKGGEIFAGPIWDFNLGYANVDYWPFGLSTENWLFNQVESHDWSIMFYWKRLMEDAFFKKLAATRWNNLRNKTLSNESINSIIDSVLNYTNEAQKRNYQKWPILGTYVWPNYNWENNTYNDEVNYFRNWLFERLTWMDDNLNMELLNPQANIWAWSYDEISQVLQLKVSIFDDYFNHSILKKKYFNLFNAPIGFQIEDVIYENASTAIVNISGINYNFDLGTEFSIELESEILNGFEPIKSNTIKLLVDNKYSNLSNQINITYYQNKLKINCQNIATKSLKLEIYNAFGQLILINEFRPQKENIFNVVLPDNIYIVKVYSSKESYSKKIFVQ